AGMCVDGLVSAPAADPQSSSLLVTIVIGAAGRGCAAVAAVTAQLRACARAASGMAGAVLTVSFVIRGIGDMSAVSDGGLERLSWFSPVGWAQQTAPFTLDRWWPLLYSAGLFAVLVALSL